MKRHALSICIVTLIVCSVAPLQADEEVIQLPSGWFADPVSSPFDLRGDAFAVAIYQGSPPWTQTRVVQYVGGANHSTDLPGRVSRLEYSPAGDYLLVHSKSVEWTKTTVEITLVDLAGSIVWTKTDTRFFNFSSTGERLYAMSVTPGLSVGSTVEIFDLDGSSISTVSFATGPTAAQATPIGLTGFALIGTGDEAIVSRGRMVERLRLAPSVTPVWSLNLESSDPSSIDLRAIDNGRVVVTMPEGRFKVFSTEDGTLEYDHEPDTMTVEYPGRTFAECSAYKAFPGETPDALTLVNGTMTKFSVDLVTGQTVEAEDPHLAELAGFVLRKDVKDQKVVLVAPRQVRIRSLL